MALPHSMFHQDDWKYQERNLPTEVINDNKLKLTSEANKKCLNFLDITFDLRSANFKPYAKPRNIPVYINVDSNHPPSILRRIFGNN